MYICVFSGKLMPKSYNNTVMPTYIHYWPLKLLHQGEMQIAK